MDPSGTINPAALNTPGKCFVIDIDDVPTAARIVALVILLLLVNIVIFAAGWYVGTQC
jgi:hypothetical protein